MKLWLCSLYWGLHILQQQPYHLFAACCTVAKNLETDTSVLILKRLHFFLCFNKSILYCNVGTPLNGSGKSVSLIHLMQPDCWSPIIWLAAPQEFIWFDRCKHDQPHPKHQSQEDSSFSLNFLEPEQPVGGLCSQLRTSCPLCFQQIICHMKASGAAILNELWLQSDFKHKYKIHCQTEYLGLWLSKLWRNYSHWAQHCQDFLFECLEWYWALLKNLAFARTFLIVLSHSIQGCKDFFFHPKCI